MISATPSAILIDDLGNVAAPVAVGNKTIAALVALAVAGKRVIPFNSLAPQRSTAAI